MANAAPIDTNDMPAVHRVFRQSFGAAPDLVSSAAGPDPARVELIGSYYFNVLEFLKVHHSGEDLLVYPKLRERAPEASPLIDQMTAQHEDVQDKIAGSLSALSAWQSTGSPADGAALQTRLVELGRELDDHLDEEEEGLLPFCAAYLSEEEWGQLPGHGLSSFQGDNIWLILGLIREQFTEAQVANMEAHMPPPVLEAWNDAGETVFTDMITAVRAGP
jgi:hypothetical protein